LAGDACDDGGFSHFTCPIYIKELSFYVAMRYKH
jgi:hypothetical protein